MSGVPVYASSVIDNYKRMFREKYARETKLDAVKIWEVFNSVYDDSSNQAQDALRVETMFHREREPNETL